jgi:hypothetical protein
MIFGFWSRLYIKPKRMYRMIFGFWSRLYIKPKRMYRMIFGFWSCLYIKPKRMYRMIFGFWSHLYLNHKNLAELAIGKWLLYTKSCISTISKKVLKKTYTNIENMVNIIFHKMLNLRYRTKHVMYFST